MINWEFVGLILPGKGLRLGDPLSPYVFIHCTEGLLALLRYREMRGDIDGVKVCRGSPILSHLLFADDYFFFFFAGLMKKRLTL